MGITWKDMIRNEEVRRRSGQERLEDNIRQRRLRWMNSAFRAKPCIGCLHQERREADREKSGEMQLPEIWKS